jgi:hypothetical protein
MDMNERYASFQLGGLTVWIEGYEFPDAADYWDANWVMTRVQCTGQHTVVKLRDPCLRLPVLASWADACRRLLNGESDTAALAPMEPYLDITIDREAEPKGLVTTVKITPDNVTEFHEFRFPIEPSHVEKLIESISVVLSRLPLRS